MVASTIEPADPPLRARSTLHRLVPRGLNRGLPEAITSYVMRLAASHSLTAGSLVRHVLGRWLIDSRARVSSQFVSDAATANGLGPNARAWATAVSDCTQIDTIDDMTFLRFAGALSHVHFLARRVRHCPTCLREMAQAGLVYEPLAWMLELSTVCPVHGCRLLEACPQCGRSQPVFASTARPGMCRSCDAWLGESVPDSSSTDWERFASRTLFEIAALIPTDGRPVTEATVRRGVEAAITARRIEQSEVAKAAGVAAATLSVVRRGQHRASLEVLLRLCALGGWSLASLLRGDLVVVSEPVRPPGSPWVGRHERHWQDIEREVRARHLAEDPPLSVSAICALVHVDQGAFRTRLPMLAGDIDERRRTYIAERARNRAREVTAIVTEITTDLLASGGSASRRQVEELLPGGLSLRERQLQAAWHDARDNWLLRE